jgi:hypothetical protein
MTVILSPQGEESVEFDLEADSSVVPPSAETPSE